KIRLIAYDHVYQPPKAVTNAKRLIERDHIFVMMGHLGTPTTKAIKEYLEERKVPNIFPSTAASMWVTSGPGHIGDLATYADQTWMIIDYLVKEKKIKKIASFYQDDEYGLDGHLAGKARLKQHELAYVAEVDYKRADIDFSSQAAKLKESGAEAVILQAVYREPPRLAEQCHALGSHPPFNGPPPAAPRAGPRHRLPSALHRPLADRRGQDDRARRQARGRHDGRRGLPATHRAGRVPRPLPPPHEEVLPKPRPGHHQPLRLPEGRALRGGHAARRAQPHARVAREGHRVHQGLGPGLGPQVQLRRGPEPGDEPGGPSGHRERWQVDEDQRLGGAEGGRAEVGAAGA